MINFNMWGKLLETFDSEYLGIIQMTRRITFFSFMEKKNNYIFKKTKLIYLIMVVVDSLVAA